MLTSSVIQKWFAAARSATLCLSLWSCLLEPSTGQSHYYTVNRGTGIRSRLPDHGTGGMLDTLQRGHEGLMVQLDALNTAIKEDELKLNNVFYKLGRHDTDIQSTTSVQISLKDTARKLETKLNKQAYNVDFLRRHVSDLMRGVEKSSSIAASVTALQTTVSTLQQSLAEALYRTSQLENKTAVLQEAGPRAVGARIDDKNIYYASRSPKTTYYYLDADAIEGVCDESNGWVSTPEGGCWWMGDTSDVTTFAGAVAACGSRGAVLAQVPNSKEDWPSLLNSKLDGNIENRAVYWTSGTSAFSPGNWVYLFSGAQIPTEHWTNGSPSDAHTFGSNTRHCAAMTPSGLVAASCTMRYAYVCEKL